ncbi:hypothetical protein VPNG_02575 [Cytospora leucostoma]|uniref:Uncharacterized protein n=1 Tax=Cytospora leucostoma TaxID=1230097 RepID=A0A423XHP7_9PEZI|nr:hypothetical protein VPNG_02575 [Cytospora leucostoma]
MRLRTATLIATLGLIQLLVSPIDGAPTDQFDAFFPAWNAMIQKYLQDPDICAAPYAAYKTGHVQADGASSLVTPVIECILQQFPEFRKAEMAASAVILGLLPTILQGLGSTSVETSLLGLRRRTLAMLCAAGSPAVALMSAGEFVETASKLITRDVVVDAGLSSPQTSKVRKILISVLQYALVGGAVANVGHLTYRLSARAIVVFAPETNYLLAIWTALSIVVHLVGVLALSRNWDLDHGFMMSSYRLHINDRRYGN